MSGIGFHIDGATAVLTLNNPSKLNALTIDMLDALEARMQQVERDSAIRSLVLTGAGEKAFCCGADIGAWGGLSPAEFARHWVCGTGTGFWTASHGLVNQQLPRSTAMPLAVGSNWPVVVTCA